MQQGESVLTPALAADNAADADAAGVVAMSGCGAMERTIFSSSAIRCGGKRGTNLPTLSVDYQSILQRLDESEEPRRTQTIKTALISISFKLQYK